MSTSSAPLLRICNFHGPFLSIQPYLCYTHEMCCKEGCCTEFQHKYFQSWYFWIGMIILFIFYRYICWYCRKSDRRNIDTLRTHQSDDSINSNVVNFMVSYSNRFDTLALHAKEDEDASDPPPLYTIAVNLPKPHSNNDEIPTYEEATSSKEN